MSSYATDTIVALSSAHSAGSALQADPERRDLAQAIIRLSGRKALAFAGKVFPQVERTFLERRWCRLDGTVRWKSHTLTVQAYVMFSPHSYTREDIVELHVPALPWLVSSLLDDLLSAGARLAQPGEFTRRAFENGRLSLEQAEAVGALISSRTADEARAHALRLISKPSVQRQSVRGEIEELLSLVELGLDFAQEDVVVISREQMKERLLGLQRRAAQLAGPRTENEGSSAVLSAGLPRILLLGPTNAGKSSLFNRLLGRSAAIVSSRPHTTRDALEAPLRVGEFSALLLDTAGGGLCGTGRPTELAPSDCPCNRDPSHAGAGTAEQNGATGNLAGKKPPASPPVPHSHSEYLRQAAWNVTLSAVRCADIVLLTVDRTVPLAQQDGLAQCLDALAQANPSALAVLWTKTDLPAAAGWEFDAALCGTNGQRAPVELARLKISSHDGTGISELEQFLAARLAELSTRPQDAALAAAVHARRAAASAAAALARAAEALEQKLGEDAVAVELREAIHAFWETEGVLLRHDALTEATLNRIFSGFCIGK
ncbi:MAG TPA: GTPase [Planctomycetota bacterium]|jgi:tRNA U34 5-carboxymethylaminomethyl modifying GTPase MnmE/TrmE